MKDQLQLLNVSSVPALQAAIKRLWVVGTPRLYLRKLSDSMPKRLKLVRDSKGEMTKY